MRELRSPTAGCLFIGSIAPFLLLLAGIATALAACGSGDSPAGQMTETSVTPSMMAEQETQPISPLVGATPGDSSADLRQLAVTLTTWAREGEWDAVRPFVPQEIASLDDSLIHRALSGTLLSAGVGTDVADWEVEENSEWTTVRLSDIPFVALVFREGSEDSYYLDPGPHVLQRAAQYPDTETLAPAIQSPEGYQQQLVTEHDDDLMPISRHLNMSVEGISRDGSDVTLTVSWMFNHGAGGSLPLDGLRWTAGDTSGDVEIFWTTAKMTGDELLFPVPEGLQEGQSYGYTISFSPIDAPTGGELHLLVEGVTLNLSDGEQFTFSIDHAIPAVSSD